MVCLLATAVPAQAPVGDVLPTADATVKGSVALTVSGTRLLSGSSIAAGASTASVRLMRGGQLHVCRGTNVSLTSSASGRDLMVGLSSGTIETHYVVTSSTDTIMTPDFQISLLGPGIFQLAVSTDQRGNTCVQTLPDNTGVVRLSELMGDGTYSMKTDEQAFFRAGRATNPGTVLGNCGCPKALPVLAAELQRPQPASSVAVPTHTSPIEPVAQPAPANLTAPPPSEKPGDIHIQVEAPFVFRASEPAPVAEAPLNIARIHVSSLPAFPDLQVQPPPDPSGETPALAEQRPVKKKKRGFWAFLASIFGSGR